MAVNVSGSKSATAPAADGAQTGDRKMETENQNRRSVVISGGASRLSKEMDSAAPTENNDVNPELPSPRVRDAVTEADGSYYSYEVTKAGRGETNTVGTSPVERLDREPLKERTSREHRSGRRYQGGPSMRTKYKDQSITQFAVIDDDNVSALQQVTRGGGGLTLASQWKSQFDDSEETDNEWKGEHLQSPEHNKQASNQSGGLPGDGSGVQQSAEKGQATVSAPQSPHAATPVEEKRRPPDLSRISEDSRQEKQRSSDPHSHGQSPQAPDMTLIQAESLAQHIGQGVVQECRLHIPAPQASRQPSTPASVRRRAAHCLNIAGIEEFEDLQAALPHSWSLPQIAGRIRVGLEPPLLQQAAFDEYVYEVDVMRNIALKRTLEEKENDRPHLIPERRQSLPPLKLCAVEPSSPPAEEPEMEAVAFRLEIRVLDKAGGGAALVETVSGGPGSVNEHLQEQPGRQTNQQPPTPTSAKQPPRGILKNKSDPLLGERACRISPSRTTEDIASHAITRRPQPSCAEPVTLLETARDTVADYHSARTIANDSTAMVTAAATLNRMPPSPGCNPEDPSVYFDAVTLPDEEDWVSFAPTMARLGLQQQEITEVSRNEDSTDSPQMPTNTSALPSNHLDDGGQKKRKPGSTPSIAPAVTCLSPVLELGGSSMSVDEKEDVKNNKKNNSVPVIMDIGKEAQQKELKSVQIQSRPNLVSQTQSLKSSSQTSSVSDKSKQHRTQNPAPVYQNGIICTKSNGTKKLCSPPPPRLSSGTVTSSCSSSGIDNVPKGLITQQKKIILSSAIITMATTTTTTTTTTTGTTTTTTTTSQGEEGSQCSAVSDRSDASSEHPHQHVPRSKIPVPVRSPRCSMVVSSEKSEKDEVSSTTGDPASAQEGVINRRYSEDDRAHAARVLVQVLNSRSSSSRRDGETQSEHHGSSIRRSVTSPHLPETTGQESPNNRPVPLCYQRSVSTEEDLGGCTPALRRRRQADKYVTDEAQLNLRFQRRRHRPSSSSGADTPPSITNASGRQSRPRSAGPGVGRDCLRGIPSHLLGSSHSPSRGGEESSDTDSLQMGIPQPPPHPPPGQQAPPRSENTYRCRRFQPVAADQRES